MLRHRNECFDVVSGTDYADIRKNDVVTLGKEESAIDLSLFMLASTDDDASFSLCQEK